MTERAKLLEPILDTARRSPFVWGKHDCALFAASIVAALTGVDHAASFRGRYRSALGAARILKKAGGLPIIATRALGHPVEPRRALSGDVLLGTFGPDIALGVCVGARGAFLAPHGLVFIPLLDCSLAWHV